MTKRLLSLIFFGLLIAAGAPKTPVVKSETALDRYVAAPDPSYKWEVVKSTPGEGYTTFVLSMTGCVPVVWLPDSSGFV